MKKIEIIALILSFVAFFVMGVGTASLVLHPKYDPDYVEEIIHQDYHLDIIGDDVTVTSTEGFVGSCKLDSISQYIINDNL